MANNSNRILLANYIQGQGLGNKNYVLNPSAMLNQTQSIVLGAGVSSANVTRNTTTPITAVSDFQIAFDSATNEYVEWTLGTIDRADLNGNCQFTGAYKLSLGSGATVQAQVYQGSNLAATVDLVNTSTVSRFSVNVPCGDGSSATTVRFAQTVSTNASTLNVADLYYGRALNVGNVDAYTSWQSYTPTYTGLGTVTNSQVFWRRVGDSIQIKGQFTTGTVTGTPALISLPSGLTANSSKQSTGLEIVGVIDANEALGNTFIRYIVAQPGLTTFAITRRYGVNSDTPLTLQNATSILASSTVHSFSPIPLYTTKSFLLSITIPIQGWSSEIAVSNGQQKGFGSVQWDGVDNAYAEITSASWTTLNNSNFSVANGSYLGSAAGTTTTGDVGLKITNLPAGTYLVTATGTIGAYRTSSNTNCGFAVYDGTDRKGFVQQTTASGTVFASSVSGIFNYSSVGDRNFVMQAIRFEGDGACFAKSNSTSNEGITFSVIPLTQSLPAPILVGSVTSNSTGAERIERVQFGGASVDNWTGSGQCTSSPCTIWRQSGSWASSVTRAGTGDYTVNFASGMFSSAPTCTFSANAQPSSTGYAVQISAITSSAISFKVRNGTDSAFVDAALNVLCMGSR